jgi:hypothetical protein
LGSNPTFAPRSPTGLAKTSNSIGVHRDFLRQLALVDRIEVELHDWDRSDRHNPNFTKPPPNSPGST